MAKPSRPEPEVRRKAPPAITPEGRETQLIALSYDLVEKRLRAGTASAQETTHFLKLGSLTTKIERRILEKQEELITAKTDSLRSAKRSDELFAEAIVAMRAYRGEPEPDDHGP